MKGLHPVSSLCLEDRLSKRWMPRTIGDAPDRLILFDGVCVLCSWWVRFVIERDAGARFRFVATQTPRGSALATRLGVDVANPETNVAIINGRAYFKSDATIRVLADLPRWSWSRILLLLPRGARDWAYDRIARNRYRLLVGTKAVLSRHRRSLLAFCSTTHRRSSRDGPHPYRRRDWLCYFDHAKERLRRNDVERISSNLSLD